MRCCAVLYGMVVLASAGMAQTAHNYCGVIESVSDSEARLKALHWGEQPCELEGTPPLMAIQVQGQALKDSMKNWKPGDRVVAGITEAQAGAATILTLQDLKTQTSSSAI